MARPDPIQYAERLYGAICAANFSPISFLAFGNAVKDGVTMRNMPRIAAEPFMRVVGEMLDLEETAGEGAITDATLVNESAVTTTEEPSSTAVDTGDGLSSPATATPESPTGTAPAEKRRKR
jgi:hypothetical protein